MARLYFDEQEIQERLQEIIKEEGRILNSLEFRAALH